MKKRLFAVLLTLMMLLSLCPAVVCAQSLPPQDFLISGQSDVHSNPLYPDAPPSGELHFPEVGVSPAATTTSHYGSVTEVAGDIRDYMTNRTESFTVYLFQPDTDEEDAVTAINTASELAFELALEHTGIPVEGDYLRWHWAYWQTNWSASYTDGGYNVTITYAIDYYTTAAQEQEMDRAVDALLAELDVAEDTDYRKIRAVYDYLCENVTYDYENLNDQNHTLKFTAYAALIDGTAVCQGYASLFYRLALTLGVDARLIAGDAGGPHAWNIARLNDLYYNLDSTWDAGVAEYRYFLVNEAHFTDHTRYADYTSDAFYAAYPMSETDFDPETDIPHVHSYTATEILPTCTEDGYTLYTCDCGDSYRGDVVPARGHQWDEGVITIEPTETETGLMIYTCLVCGEISEKIIPELNHQHSYESVVTPPSCTEDGFTTHTCICGDSYTDSHIPATGHNPVADPAMDPTCTQNGLTEGSHCDICGQVLIPQQSIPATGHHLGPWTVVQEPTGTDTGTEERRCDCGMTEYRSIPRLENPFSDVRARDYFFEPVLWASYRGITSGVSPTRFGPGEPCTRAQVVTFLWRAAGQPKPESADNPFSDVKKSAYYYDAVLWAVENGITAGISPTRFGPGNPCTRAQVVTFLWRASEQPDPGSTENPFSDLKQSDYYQKAVLWAVENGITSGTGNGRFSPGQTCTRGQVVSFLYRANH